jgi:hypothetical protein
MSQIDNPGLAAFVAQIHPELILAQVRILRLPQGFELRHVADLARATSDLRLLQIPELRAWAQTSAQGTFRPLKSAPTLRPGWYSRASGPEDLDLALNRLYPGAVADWHAARSRPVPVTHYREFTARQTGMYRLTQQLDDNQAARVARVVCHRRFCLKHRLWLVGDLAPEPASDSDKSIIPCLEPCPVLLEFAKKAAGWGQEEAVTLHLSSGEIASFRHLLQAALDSPLNSDLREADFDEPINPRRLQWILDQNCFS